MWVRPEPVESCARFGCQGTVWISEPGYAPPTLLPEQSSTCEKWSSIPASTIRSRVTAGVDHIRRRLTVKEIYRTLGEGPYSSTALSGPCDSYYLRAQKGIEGSCVSTSSLSLTGEELQNGLYWLKAFDGSVGFVGLQIVQ